MSLQIAKIELVLKVLVAVVTSIISILSDFKMEDSL